MTKFSDWLTSRIADRKISPAELSRLMRKDPGLISRMLRGERNPSNETLKAISKALDISEDDVFRAAGYLPPIADENPVVREISHTSKQLDESEQLEILEIIKMKLRLAKSRGKNEKVPRPTK